MSTPQQNWEPVALRLPLVGVMNAPSWYAIHTRARHEKQVTTHLREKGVITFLPLITQRHRWSDREQSVQVALFSCYTFVSMEACAENRLCVLHTAGVLGFVGVHGVGLPIPEKQIEDIQTLLAHNVTFGLCPFLNVGQRVRIRGGCLEGVEGILVAKNTDRSLVVSVEMIQRSIAVRVDGYDLEPA